MRKQALLIALILILLITGCTQVDKVITLATTTSTENSGLLETINPEFEKKTGIKVKVIALGTGAAIKTAEEGNADLILVHARDREDEFVADGFGVNRKDVMYNDFIIIGPQNDPAAITGESDVTRALKKIAQMEQIFVSRGDDSGTHIKEQSLWQATDLVLDNVETEIGTGEKKRVIKYIKPAGDWYYSIGQGMGNTINFAFEKQGYTLADRGTYLAYKEKIDLVILCGGDKRLFNPYGIIAVNPQKHEHVKYEQARQYINWIVSVEAQKLIGNYKLDNEVLFFPDAIK